MFKILIFSALAWFLVGFVFNLLGFLAFDKIIKNIKNKSEIDWTNLGRPIGFFWTPKGCKVNIGQSFARGEYARLLISLNTIKDFEQFPDPVNLSKLRIYHRMGRVCIIFCFFSFFLAIFSLFFSLE